MGVPFLRLFYQLLALTVPYRIHIVLSIIRVVHVLRNLQIHLIVPLSYRLHMFQALLLHDLMGMFPYLIVP